MSTTPKCADDGRGAALAKVFVTGLPRLSLAEGERPDNHYQFSP